MWTPSPISPPHRSFDRRGLPAAARDGSRVPPRGGAMGQGRGRAAGCACRDGSSKFSLYAAGPRRFPARQAGEACQFLKFRREGLRG